MKRRFWIYTVAILLAGLGGLAGNAWLNQPGRTVANLQSDLAKYAVQLGRTNTPVATVLAPLDLSHPVRLAVGGLGLADNEENQQLGDLITMQLSGAPGFELVERQALDTVLQELNLSRHGFVRAKDAVRVGKLLKVDWFLLGTEAIIGGTNSRAVRVVDARTGVMRDGGVFPADKPLAQQAADMAAFVRQTRANAANARSRVFLALGTWDDLSVNNRREDFSSRLRGYLTAAYQGGEVTVLERDHVDTLLRELNLDAAGLVEKGSTNRPSPMQSAFWLVNGEYQSYETTNLQLEVKLRIECFFGFHKELVLRGLPDDSFCRQIKAAIDAAMNENRGIALPTLATEMRAMITAGREVVHMAPESLLVMEHSSPFVDTPEVVTHHRHRMAEGIRAFETALLLDPGSREAKLYLAECLLDDTIDRYAEAGDYYREMLEVSTKDKWGREAQWRLSSLLSYENKFSPEEKLRWCTLALEQNTNADMTGFYREQKKAAEKDVIIEQGDGSKAETAAEQRLFETVKSTIEMNKNGTGTGYGSLGMYEFIQTYGADRAGGERRLAELYPKLKATCPEMAPMILEEVIYYQSTTNTPLLAEVEQNLDWQIAHPQEVYQGNDLERQSSLYRWCMEKGCFALALKSFERNRLVAGGGLLQPLDDKSKIELAYADMGLSRWKEALELFECFSNRPVVITENGPWGPGLCPIRTAYASAYCRKQAGLPVVRDPREFDLGRPVLIFDTPAALVADTDGFWVGMDGKLLQLGFDLKTNLVVDLPGNVSARVSTICCTASNLWIATTGNGLIEFDKQSHLCRQFTVADGLMMNGIASLSMVDGTLWIGYGYMTIVEGVEYGQSTAGGLGRLNLATGKFSSFTPSMADALPRTRDSAGPPRDDIRAITSRSAEEVWFLTEAEQLHRYESEENKWTSIPDAGDGVCLAADGGQLFVGTYHFPYGETKATTGPLGVHMLNFKTGQWRSFTNVDYLMPGVVSTLTLEGDKLWVGGVGYIALIDPWHDRVIRYAYVKARSVNRIQSAGGYLWAQFDACLFRIPLSKIQ